jgi:hypothetical protein
MLIVAELLNVLHENGNFHEKFLLGLKLVIDT